MSRPASREAVLGALRSALPSLRADYPIRRMALFGSVARGSARSDSDIDVLVDLDGGDLFTLVHLSERLRAAVGHPVHLVVDAHRLPESLRLALDRESIDV